MRALLPSYFLAISRRHEIGRNTIKRILLQNGAFRGVLGSSGVRTLKLPARSPDLNAYAERFVRSIKSECLAQIIPLGEGHLRTAVKEYTELERNERLGGILNYYPRRAA